MVKDKMEELRDKYSEMFDGYLQGREIECGDGWYDLISNTLEELKSLNQNVKIIQIKEKFGLLRMYVDGGSKAGKIVFDAERRSAAICERCGEPGVTSNNKNSWVRTLCEKCRSDKDPK